jgi:hypothetical protein
MRIQNNDEFLKYLSINDPNVDWDNLSESDFKITYQVKGMQYVRSTSSGKNVRDKAEIVSEIFETKEEAENELQNMLTSESHQTEHLAVQSNNGNLYFGPTINDSLKVVKRMPDILICKRLRDSVLKNPEKDLFDLGIKLKQWESFLQS